MTTRHLPDNPCSTGLTRLAGGICLLVLSLSLLGYSDCAASPENPNAVELYFQAMSAHEEGDDQECRILLQRALDMGSNHPALLARLAGACALTGDPEAAMGFLEQLAEIGARLDLKTDDWFTGLKDHPDLDRMVQRLESGAAPVSQSTTAFTIPEKRLIPEGIAGDPATGDLILGSLVGPRLLRIAPGAEMQVFYDTESETDWYGLGMKVHGPTNSLWVCRKSPDDSCAVGLFVYDLESGRQARRILLDDRSGPHLLNDLVLTDSGNAFITDSDANCMYTLAHDADSLEPFPVELSFRYPNGIALSDDESLLFVAHSMGILRIDLASTEVTALAAARNTLIGFDGLYCRGSSLIGVQNGMNPMRVVRFDLDADMKAVTGRTILERDHPLFGAIPTTGALVGDRFIYIANSQMRQLDDNREFPDPEALQDVILLGVDLREP